MADLTSAATKFAQSIADAPLRFNDAIQWGDPVTAGSTFGEALRAVTANCSRWTDGRLRVEVQWAPYQDAPLVGRITAGPEPPATVDASVTTLRVPVPVATVDDEAVRRHGGGFEGVATAIANATVAATLPTDRVAFGDPGSATRAVGTRRYRLAASAVGTSVDDALDENAPGRAAAAVRRGLTTRLEMDLRERFDSPDTALEAVETGYATVRVVEWES